MDILREPTDLYTDRFFTSGGKTAPTEIVYGMLGGQAVCCPPEERRRERRGEYEGPLREYW